MIFNNNIWEIDPFNMSKNISHLIDYELGLIPSFINAKAVDIELTALDLYRFGGPEMIGCDVSANGILSYPNDPDMYPIAQCNLPQRKYTIYVYQYGIVSFVNKNNLPYTWKVYRFD